MSDFKDFKLDYAAVGRILKSDTIMNVCRAEAQKRASSDEHIKSFVGFDRCHAFIYPNTKKNP